MSFNMQDPSDNGKNHGIGDNQDDQTQSNITNPNSNPNEEIKGDISIDKTLSQMISYVKENKEAFEGSGITITIEDDLRDDSENSGIRKFIIKNDNDEEIKSGHIDISVLANSEKKNETESDNSKPESIESNDSKTESKSDPKSEPKTKPTVIPRVKRPGMSSGFQSGSKSDSNSNSNSETQPGSQPGSQTGSRILGLPTRLGNYNPSEIDPFTLLFANILTSLNSSQGDDSDSEDKNSKETNRFGTGSLGLPFIKIDLDYGGDSDSYSQQTNIKQKEEDENKKIISSISDKNEINDRRIRSNTELGVEDNKNTESESKVKNISNRKQSQKLDFHSTIGDIGYLTNWLKENIDENGKFNGNPEDYTSDTIDHASSNGKISVLDWWKKVNKENDVPLKYTKKAMILASRSGQIATLDWWINSGLELKYDEDAVDYASNSCKINVLNWWFNNFELSKVKFIYSNKAIDNARLEEDRLITLLKWWNEKKINKKIEFKYTKSFISYLDSWGYKNAHKYLLDNGLISPEEKLTQPSQSSQHKDKSPIIGLFDLLGTPLGIRKSKESVNNKIDISKLPEDIQKHIKEKEEELNNNMMVNGKAKEYIDSLVKIPFGKYKNENIFSFMGDLIKKINYLNSKHKNKTINKITVSNESDLVSFYNKIEFNMDDEYSKYFEIYKKFIDIRVEYLEYVNNILEETIYGHESTKKQIKCIIAQWLSGGINKGIVLGIHGPPGVGKTTVIKGALSKCLVNFISYNLDKYDPVLTINSEHTDGRPFCFMSLGGTTNGSTLVGHNITYHGATSGDIVKHLKEAGVMNPILYFDELDKISNTEHGHEISSVLTHITDPVQNEHFTDRYFSEVKIDLSRCIIIFSYNDPGKIDRILLDRIQEIKLEAIRLDEKIEICKKFLIPEICKNIGYNTEDITISDEKLSMIILEYTHEAGVRKLKEKLQEIIRMKHLQRLENKTIPTKNKIVNKFINETFEDYHKINYKKIHSEPRTGYINGMYATASGLGGITIIQVKPIYHKEVFGLQITGSVEKVMNESIQVAKTVAYNLLTRQEQTKLIEEYKDTGLHVHCPEGATPKDGPSAGAAITSAIYSTFIGRPIKNDIAITGEIDLDGNVTMIGGLDAKLSGAKRAGVKLALVPKDNSRDVDIIKRKNPDLIDKDFKVKFVSRIEEVIKFIF